MSLTTKTTGILTAAFILAGAAALGTAYTVDETERGLLYTWGSLDTQETAELIQPGLHFKIPVAQNVRIRPLDTQTLEIKNIETYTKDNQVMTARLVINYREPADQLVRMAKENPDFLQKLDQMTQDRFKKIMGTKESVEIASNRVAIGQEITDFVRAAAMKLYGVEILDVQMPNYNFSKEFEHAVEKAALVKTEVSAEKERKAKQTIIAQTAKIKAAGLAEAAIENARGAAKSVRLAAEAETYRIEQTGAAKAEAADLLAKAIAGNPAIVQYKIAENWDGAVSIVGGGGQGGINLLQMDMNTLAAAATKAPAPAPQ